MPQVGSASFGAGRRWPRAWLHIPGAIVVRVAYLSWLFRTVELKEVLLDMLLHCLIGRSEGVQRINHGTKVDKLNSFPKSVSQ